MFRILLIFSLLTTTLTFSQELACNVTVDARQTGNENLQIFRSLQTQLTDFINNTTWTGRKIRNNERIDCNMFINISSYDNDVFQATLQIQSSRPIYNSSYNSPVYNFNDKNFTFRYQEFQNLRFNADVFESNLVSVLAFHIYMILGIDADTFDMNSGDVFYRQAQKILDYSQQNGFKGWAANDGLQSRYYLIDNILSPTYKEYRVVLHDYHFKGLDFMNTDVKQAKNNIAKSLMMLEQMNRRRPNSFILRVFFDTKSNEIQDIFSDGPSVPVTNLISALSKIAPNHSDKWRKISF
tara:strand:+ start:651 stop:1538 length:888 start_codon:yes stop_codon:yes gene_type:complete